MTRLISGVRHQISATAGTREGLLRVVRFTPSDALSVSAPRFVVENVIPRGYVTLLSGHGGAGKSQLALSIAAHVAAGRRFASLEVEQGRVLFLTLEDPAGLVCHRLIDIIRAYGFDQASIDRHLQIVDGESCDASLAIERVFGGRSQLEEAQALEQLDDLSCGAALVVVDNASDGFEANANDPRLVRTFVRRFLGRIARKHDAGVLLLAHIDKDAARHGARGNSYIGTTAWHNSARSRLALLNEGEVSRLVHEKSNLSRRAKPITLCWTDNGVPMPAESSNADDTAARAIIEAADESGVLAALRSASKSGVSVSPARSGSGNAHATLKNVPELPKYMRESAGRERFFHALHRLQDKARVRIEEYQNEHRHLRRRLVAVEAPVLARVNSPIPPSALTRAGTPRPAPDCAPSTSDAELTRTGALPAGSEAAQVDGTGVDP
jgi:KaiC/GvpD/RAD55 family RecA-like ATPase